MKQVTDELFVEDRQRSGVQVLWCVLVFRNTTVWPTRSPASARTRRWSSGRPCRSPRATGSPSRTRTRCGARWTGATIWSRPSSSGAAASAAAIRPNWAPWWAPSTASAVWTSAAPGSSCRRRRSRTSPVSSVAFGQKSRPTQLDGGLDGGGWEELWGRTNQIALALKIRKWLATIRGQFFCEVNPLRKDSYWESVLTLGPIVWSPKKKFDPWGLTQTWPSMKLGNASGSRPTF